jgi:hypothetical protein
MLTVREVRAWIETLPLANPARTARLLHQQLRILVSDPNPGPRFAALLQLYHRPLEQLLLFVYERLQNNPDNVQPLDQLEYQVIELLLELAHGHLRAANELLSAGKQPTPETLFHATVLLDNALNIERLHYHRPAPHSWRLLLHIFQQAEQQQAAAQAVASRLRQEGDPATVRGLFLRTLVVSLADPHSHRPREVLSWLRWSGEHTDRLQLTLLPQGAFAIPIDISAALPPLAAARCGKPGPDTRFLAADDFLQLAEDDPEAPPGLRAALVDVIKGRKAPEQRQSPRQAASQPYRLLRGLRDTHRRLAELTGEAAQGSPDAAAVAAVQVNQSKHGAAFHLQGPLAPPLNIGELVLAEAEGRGGEAPVGFTGCIQRLVNGEHGRVEIGVAKLLGRLVPVTITGAAAARLRGETKALLLQAGDSGALSLIASRIVYRDGDVVTIEGPNTRYNLRMLRISAAVQHTVTIEVEEARAG